MVIVPVKASANLGSDSFCNVSNIFTLLISSVICFKYAFQTLLEDVCSFLLKSAKLQFAWEC